MESYGSLLKTARENKEMTILDVERDTAITRQYIEAMEEEDAAVFPGEAYLIGFLHNYAEFLGLNGDMIVSLYKNKKLQESPIPDGLVPKHRPVWIIPLVSLLILAGLGGIVFGTVKLVGFITMLQAQKAEAEEETQRFHTYTLSEKPLQRRIYKGDHILVPQSEGNIDLAVANTLGLLQLETPAGLQVIDLSDEVELDIDNDGVSDMIVYVSDVSNTDSDRGAEVRMLLKRAVRWESQILTKSSQPMNCRRTQLSLKSLRIIVRIRLLSMHLSAQIVFFATELTAKSRLRTIIRAVRSLPLHHKTVRGFGCRTATW